MGNHSPLSSTSATLNLIARGVRTGGLRTDPWDLIRIMPVRESDSPAAVRIVRFHAVTAGHRMQLYEPIYLLFAWSLTIAILGFITFPWAMVAFKVWHGFKPIDEDLRDELLQRSWYFGWSLGFLAIVFGLLDFATADSDWLGMPAGPVHIVYYIGFLAIAAWMMMYFFSMEDFFQGLSMTVIYLYIPAALLFVLWLLIRWNWLFKYVLSWLKEPTA